MKSTVLYNYKKPFHHPQILNRKQTVNQNNKPNNKANHKMDKQTPYN